MTRLFDKSASNNKQLAKVLYGIAGMYLYGLHHQTKNVKSAILLFYKAAKKNEKPYSQYAVNQLKKMVDQPLELKKSDVEYAANLLAECYVKGYGTEKQLGLAKELWNRTGVINSEDFQKEESDHEEDVSSSCGAFSYRR